jgi:hypothetical protein
VGLFSQAVGRRWEYGLTETSLPAHQTTQPPNAEDYNFDFESSAFFVPSITITKQLNTH